MTIPSWEAELNRHIALFAYGEIYVEYVPYDEAKKLLAEHIASLEAEVERVHKQIDRLNAGKFEE